MNKTQKPLPSIEGEQTNNINVSRGTMEKMCGNRQNSEYNVRCESHMRVTFGSDGSYRARTCQAAGRPRAEQVAGAWRVCGTGKDTSVLEQGSRVAGSKIRKEIRKAEPVATVAFTLGDIRSHLT